MDTNMMAPQGMSGLEDNPAEEMMEGEVEEMPELFNFTLVLPRLKKLIDDWEPVIRQTNTNRKMRKLDVDLDALRLSGDLKADETFIPIRVIDTNIKQDQPPFNSYLTQSRRLVIFEPLSVPRGTVDCQDMEMEFTKGMSYIGWQEPFFDWVDGSGLHGWDWIEVEKDDTKPFKVGLNYLGRENVIFPEDARDYQACEIIVVAYDFTCLKLQQFVDKGWFNEEQAEKIKEQYKDKSVVEDKTFKLYKMFCKCEGVVHVAWFSKTHCDDWLRNPEPLDLGRKRQEMVWKDVPTTIPDTMTGMPISMTMKQQVMEWVRIDETIYPLKLLRYQKTEETEITETKGRAWLDGPKQEAQTCLWSNFVNSSTRASNVYGSPKQSSKGGMPVRLELELTPGAIYSEPLELWNPPMPSFDLIRAAQSLDTQNQIETGKVAFAAVNNKDSRKTATEIGAAQQQNQLLNSVQVTLFSIALCEVWNQVWSVVQSLALQGEIPFLTQGKDPASGKFVNNTEKIALDFKLKPAGDVDVIERAELEAKREKLWPLITSLPGIIMNPLAVTFAKDMIEENFPEDAADYLPLIDQMVAQAQQMAMQQNQVGALMNVVKATVDEKRPVTPEEYKQLEAGIQGQQTNTNTQPQ